MKLYLTIAGLLVLTAGGIYNHVTNNRTSITQLNAPSTFTAPFVQAENKAVLKKSILNVKLKADQTVLIAGEIGDNATDIAQQIIEKSSHGKSVWILISSPGGSVLDGALIVDAIQSSPVAVHTVCFSICASMAAVIFEYGTDRLMVDRSLLMFHQAAGGVQGSFNQIKSRFKMFDQYVTKMDLDISKRMGMDPQQFQAKLSDEIWLDSDDAISQKYADGYVSANLGDLMSRKTLMTEHLSQVKFLKTKVNLDDRAY